MVTNQKIKGILQIKIPPNKALSPCRSLNQPWFLMPVKALLLKICVNRREFLELIQPVS